MYLSVLHTSNSSGANYHAFINWLFNLSQAYQIAEVFEHSWPKEWSDRLFVPRRVFEERRRARKFLAWLVDNGVDVQRYIDAMYDQQSVALPPPSVSGAVGRAYFVGDRVVKMTTSRHEAERASALIGLTIPNLVKFHGVARIDGFDKPLFALITDRVPDRIPGKYRIAANAVYSYLDAYDRPIADVTMAAREVIDRFVPDRYRDDAGVKSGVLKILRATDEIFRRTGILLQDPHAGNVLLRGDDIQFFDLGRSTDYSKRSVNIPSIA